MILQDESGLDYKLWQASRTLSNTQLQLAEFQAALSDTQLECCRATRKKEELQTLYNKNRNALVQS